jgi:hypothetical protein
MFFFSASLVHFPPVFYFSFLENSAIESFLTSDDVGPLLRYCAYVRVYIRRVCVQIKYLAYQNSKKMEPV